MSTGNQYKLLRNGSIRAGARRGMARSARYGANADVPAPVIDEFGHQPFSEQEAQALARRLQDSDWPRGTLNIYGLEGLLTALLVLPLGLRSGTWLPLIWNESGWKVPSVFQNVAQYRDFIEAVIGFMRTVDNGLLATTPRFTSTLDTLAEHCRPKTPHAHQDWARGFGLAVSHSDYLKMPLEPAIHRALYVIATYANPPATRQHRGDTSPPTLQQAVLTLANARGSRGPLGALPTVPKETRTANPR